MNALAPRLVNPVSHALLDRCARAQFDADISRAADELSRASGVLDLALASADDVFQLAAWSDYIRALSALRALTRRLMALQRVAQMISA